MAGRQLLHTTAVNHPNLSAQALGAAGGVHGHVAAAHHGHLLALQIHDGRIAVLPIGLHQVDTGQELIGGIHALQVLAGNMHEHGQTGAGADKHSLEAVLLHQLIDGDGTAHHGIGLNLYPHSLQAVHFLLDDGLGQTELGNTVHQHAAGQMQGLKHGDLIALLGQVACAGQARRAGTDDRHLMTVGSRLGSGFRAVGVVPVSHKALQTADTHRLALLTADAVHLTLALLRADAAAHGRQGAGLVDHLIGALVVLRHDLADKFGDLDIDRTAADTGMVLAVQAALRLVQRLLLSIAQRHFQEVAVAHVGVLGGHRILLSTHIEVRHITLPPACTDCRLPRAYAPRNRDTSDYA